MKHFIELEGGEIFEKVKAGRTCRGCAFAMRGVDSGHIADDCMVFNPKCFDGHNSGWIYQPHNDAAKVLLLAEKFAPTQHEFDIIKRYEA